MKKNLIKYEIIIPLIVFFIISIASIYSASLNISSKSIITKQVLWYLLGFILIIISTNKNLKFLTKYSFYLYIKFKILLLSREKEKKQNRLYYGKRSCL